MVGKKDRVEARRRWLPTCRCWARAGIRGKGLAAAAGAGYFPAVLIQLLCVLECFLAKLLHN